MRTTVDLPDDLLRRTKAAAAARGMKLKDLIASFIERGLGQPDVNVDRSAEKRKLPDSPSPLLNPPLKGTVILGP